MAKNNLFQKRKQERKQRDSNKRIGKANSYLIVSEGSETEVHYFEGIVTLITEEIGGNLSVQSKPHIDIRGEGRNTVSLIEYTKKIVNRSKIIYENIWVVFDKDDFKNFDEAIQLAKSNGFKVAWSNQCFEYWLYLHFHYNDSAMHRSILYNKLDDIFKSKGFGKYEKNIANIYSIVVVTMGYPKLFPTQKKECMNLIKQKTYLQDTTLEQLFMN